MQHPPHYYMTGIPRWKKELVAVRRRSLAQIVALLVISACVAACARTFVRPETEMLNFGLTRPRQILVCDFPVAQAEVTESHESIGKSVHQTANISEDQKIREMDQRVASALAEELVRELRSLGFGVERRPSGSPIESGDFLIEGEFFDVEKGNRLERLVLGFGLGASKLDTKIYVYYGEERWNLLNFGIHSDSGKMPGAAATMAVGGAIEGGVTPIMIGTAVATGALKEYYSELEGMARRSARQAVAYLSGFFAKQGWIPSDQVKKAKVHK